MNEPVRQELIAMRAEDLRVREELIQSGEMDGTSYVPHMEAVHRKNVARLRQIIAEYGWPDTVVGADGSLAAWFIAQHAIGEPDFQREVLRLVQDKVKDGRVPAAQEAYLYDRIAIYEGRPTDAA